MILFMNVGCESFWKIHPAVCVDCSQFIGVQNERSPFFRTCDALSLEVAVTRFLVRFCRIVADVDVFCPHPCKSSSVVPCLFLIERYGMVRLFFFAARCSVRERPAVCI